VSRFLALVRVHCSQKTSKRAGAEALGEMSQARFTLGERYGASEEGGTMSQYGGDSTATQARNSIFDTYAPMGELPIFRSGSYASSKSQTPPDTYTPQERTHSRRAYQPHRDYTDQERHSSGRTQSLAVEPDQPARAHKDDQQVCRRTANSASPEAIGWIVNTVKVATHVHSPQQFFFLSPQAGI